MKTSNILYKAKAKKNQSLVNKAINWLIKYNSYNDLRDIADGEGDEKAFKKWDKKCETSYDKFLEYMDELPKGQQKAIYKSKFY